MRRPWRPGFFGQGNELVGRDEAALRMLPAGEGLKAAEKAGAKLDKRLKIWNDLVIFERSAEIVASSPAMARDDTTAPPSYPVKFRARQRATRSRKAAAGQYGKLNSKPAARRRPGIT